MGGPGKLLGRARACPPNGPQLASLKPRPDGRVRASFWVGPGLAYLVRTTGSRMGTQKDIFHRRKSNIDLTDDVGEYVGKLLTKFLNILSMWRGLEDRLIRQGVGREYFVEY